MLMIMMEDPTSMPELILYSMSIVALSFWFVIWIHHLCALTNAKLKLNKRSYLCAASRRKRKLHQLKEKFLPCCLINSNPQHHHHINYNQTSYNNSNHYNYNNQDLCKQNNRETQEKASKVIKEAYHYIMSSYSPLHIDNNNNNNNNKENLFGTTKQNSLENESCTVENLQQQQCLQLLPQDSLSTPTNTDINNDFKTHEESINDPSKISHYQHQHYSFNDKNNNKDFSYINLPLPGVSIIKPLVGVDTNLHRNLETFFDMDYPTYELLFCVQDPDDAAIMIVKNLFKLYPDVDAKLFIGGTRVGVNPKINNMQPAYEAMKYELILISDSGISMKRDTLLDMVSHMREDIALVHQMPFVCDGRLGFQSIVEKVYFGTAHARAYLTADLLNINCSTGMSALMRKHLLDEVGGISAFGQYLAEDFFFAKSFTDRGWKISISSQPAWQNSASSSDSLSTLNCRIERWVKLRFAMVPFLTLIEPFSECMLLGILGALSISYLWAFNPFAVFLLHVLIWFILDYKLLCLVQNGPLTFSKTDFVIAWLFRECTALLVFIKALSNPKVTWRSRIFKLKWGGHAEEITTQIR